MDRNDFLAALERDANAFAETCAATDLHAPVPNCPEWQVADLVWHVTAVHEFWRRVIVDRWTEYVPIPNPDRPPDDELLPRSRASAAALIETLTTTDSATPVWTWTDDRTVAFVVRRMAHEMAVHNADADAAAGRVVAIDPMLASDGIDEFLNHFLIWVDPAAAPVAGSVHLHCTDVPGEWTVREREGGFDVTPEHAKGDCALRGPASDLLLALWRRQPLSSVDVVGDADVAARFVGHTSLS